MIEQKGPTLPPEMLDARPKRLRFLPFHTPGRVIHHARKMLLRLRTTAEHLAAWIEAMQLLAVPT